MFNWQWFHIYCSVFFPSKIVYSSIAGVQRLGKFIFHKFVGTDICCGHSWQFLWGFFLNIVYWNRNWNYLVLTEVNKYIVIYILPISSSSSCTFFKSTVPVTLFVPCFSEFWGSLMIRLKLQRINTKLIIYSWGRRKLGHSPSDWLHPFIHPSIFL